jgi:hypothetical protein
MAKNPVTKEDFSNIKTLLVSGFSIKKTCDIVKRSDAVVRKVDKCDNWDQYHGVKPEPIVEPKPTVMTHDQMGILQRHIDTQTEILNQILDLLKKYMEV